MLVIEHRDVDQIGSPERRQAGRDRIGRDDRRHAAVRHHRRNRGIGALDDRHETAFRRAQQVDGEAGDVMRAAMTTVPVPYVGRHRRCRIEGAQREPGPGQPLAVPCCAGRPRIDDGRLARLRHCAFLDFREIRREQCEAVRRVAEEVGGDEHVGCSGRDVVADAGVLQQRSRESTERGGGITCVGHGRLILSSRCGNRPSAVAIVVSGRGRNDIRFATATGMQGCDGRLTRRRVSPTMRRRVGRLCAIPAMIASFPCSPRR